jgi:hypothetical protein
MGGLTRTRSGMFDIQNAVTLSLFKQSPAEYLLPITQVFPCPTGQVHPQAEKLAINGNPIPLSKLSLDAVGHDFYWLYIGEQLLGLYQSKDRTCIPKVFML